ncbi:MAG: hypothetical protein HY092_02720 [Candidatus Kerfeldbacteria bacterium]|nr:hypothetical protein [Candidatus Kerfeldbacteria bacterium]
MEPKPVVPDQYRPEVWNQYGTVFTFLDNLVDHKHIFKMYYPQGQELMEQLPGWSERKFLTLMNANKYSYVQHELYSVRRQAIRYFERNPDFDLYGFDWNHNGTLNLGAASQAFKSGHWIQYVMDVIAGFRHAACYRGTVPDKRATIAKYKFAIAFENESKTQGYITEKIFDCFFAGTVPVYLGAENITYYVPADCFVDFRKFSGFAELEKFLRAMTEPEFLRYQKNGQRFLHGPAFAPWLPKNVFASITEHL